MTISKHAKDIYEKFSPFTIFLEIRFFKKLSSIYKTTIYLGEKIVNCKIDFLINNDIKDEKWIV